MHKSIAYCKKGNKFMEAGKPPMTPKDKGQVEKNRWAQILIDAKSGNFDAIDPKVQVLQCRNLAFIHQRALGTKKHPDTTTQHIWLWGKTGTGKSRMARDMYPDMYLKLANKWWDGYLGQDVVLIEDLDAKLNFDLGEHLKRWADRYAFPVETKGGHLSTIRPRVIIVTSNWAPQMIWAEAGYIEPLLRRFVVVEVTEETGSGFADYPALATAGHPIQSLIATLPMSPVVNIAALLNAADGHDGTEEWQAATAIMALGSPIDHPSGVVDLVTPNTPESSPPPRRPKKSRVTKVDCTAANKRYKELLLRCSNQEEESSSGDSEPEDGESLGSQDTSSGGEESEDEEEEEDSQ